MRQRQLIKEIARTLGQKQTNIRPVVDALIDNIQKQLLSGNTVVINHFGSLSTVRHKEKKAVIPGKEGTVIIPTQQKVQFKISKTLKTKIQALEK